MKPTASDTSNAALSRASAIYQMLSTSPGKAWKEARVALKKHPKSERVQFVAGLAQIARGKRSDARVHFANAIKLGTAEPDAYLNLAQLSAEVGQLDFALEVLGKAQARFGDDPRILQARIQAHQAVGAFEGALVAAEEAVAAHPEAVDIRLLHGLVLSENGRLLDAIAALEAVHEDHPRHVLTMINLGRFYSLTNQPARALAITERAHELSADSPVVVENLALRKRESGEFEVAVKLWDRLANISPALADEAVRQMADIIPEADVDALDKLVTQRQREARAPLNRAQLGFARAAIAKRRGDDAGFEAALKTANQLIAKLRAYDAKADTARHDKTRALFREVAPEAITEPALTTKPIFIFGLPRSGTTLLERMVSNSPDVDGLGEVALLFRFFTSVEGAADLTQEKLAALRADYAKYQAFAGSAAWSVDKMPINYQFMGWINRIFPEAKLILLRRDAKDMALSQFENYFDDADQNYSFTEAGVLNRHALFEEAVADWTELGATFLELTYEELVSDAEASLRKVADYVGVAFDEGMLKPEANTGAIRTVSSVQARRGINQDSMKRWERFPKLLPKVFGA